MRERGGPKLAEPLLEYDCPRCGDSFVCVSEEDLFTVTAHRLLHQAGAWKRSFWATRLWAMEGEGARAVAE
jgi:hypothetical protein